MSNCPMHINTCRYKPIDPDRDKFAGTYAAHRWHHLWFGRHIHKHKKPWERKVDKEIADWQGGGGEWGRGRRGVVKGRAGAWARAMPVAWLRAGAGGGKYEEECESRGGGEGKAKGRSGGEGVPVARAKPTMAVAVAVTRGVAVQRGRAWPGLRLRMRLRVRLR